MNKLKIGIFAYNFKHKKTQEGILRLYLENYKIECILAQNKLRLNIVESNIRITPKEISYVHPKKIAEKLNIPYHVVLHNSKECEKIIKDYQLDIGIILGARILKKNIINAFKIGIINLHPAMLPQNRGLDNIKWAIIKNFKQGATAHLISEEIDKGRIILQDEINIFEDDTLLDLHLRVQSKELDLLIKSLKILESGKRDFEPLNEGNYFKALPEDIEVNLTKRFEEYKEKNKKYG